MLQRTDAIVIGRDCICRFASAILFLMSRKESVRWLRLATGAVIGTMFYVMDMVEGRIFWNVSFPEVPAADRPAIVKAFARHAQQVSRLYGRAAQPCA